MSIFGGSKIMKLTSIILFCTSFLSYACCDDNSLTNDDLQSNLEMSKRSPFYSANSVCPGRYCGHMPDDDTCGACPRGYAPDDESLCTKCDGKLSFYDWLYLGFMALVSLVLHWGFIDLLSRPKRSVLFLHLSAFLESAVAALLTLLLVDPAGSLTVRSCSINNFSDWYTMFFNPTPDYYNTIFCTQEIVYPLFTLVLIYYTLSLVLMMLIRPIVSYNLPGCQGSRAMYAALYFLLILILIHSVLAGVIYYAFPYIIVVVSVITSACHLATEEDQTMKELVKQSLMDVRNLTILLGHWILHAYGIIAITQLVQPSFHAALIALVPFPTIFYIMTVRFTDPSLYFPFKTCILQG